MQVQVNPRNDYARRVGGIARNLQATDDGQRNSFSGEREVCKGGNSKDTTAVALSTTLTKQYEYGKKGGLENVLYLLKIQISAR